ncbi:MAG: ATP-binding protein [Lachnospiraceae bacterium]|nr:ATP-binding protein [Lachnospiraceae bacterium]
MPLSNSQYDSLFREYNDKQIRNQRILDERKKELYAKAPRLKEIEKSISSIAVSSAAKMLSGDTGAIDELKIRLDALKNERNELLNQLGYAPNYLTEPPYDCKDCRDTGYIDNNRCHCFRQRAIDLVYTQSNLGNILADENFDNFRFDYYPKDDINPTTKLSSYESMKTFVQKVKDFINDFDSKFENLFLYGDTGVGKTFLSNCIAKELLDTAHSVIYLSAFQLFDILRDADFERDSESMLQGDNISNCDLLIIDDLGTELSNSYTNSALFNCLNERILNKKSTIISTNLSVELFSDTYSERIMSRIYSNYELLRLSGADIRIKKKIECKKTQL